jgi:tRNA pseudouridine13 synthase
VKPIDEADRVILEQLLGQEAVATLTQLDEAIQAKKTSNNKNMPLLLGIISDRQKRGSIHQVSVCV